jgi:glycosyltransferase involved in cell wall biosynthesis
MRFAYDNSFCDAPFLSLLERAQPDVIHFQHLAHFSVGLIPLAASLGYPTVLSLHDFFFPCHRIHLINRHNQLCAGPGGGEQCVPCLEGFAPPDEIRQRFPFIEQAMRAPDVVIAPSPFLAERMLEYFPFLRERLRVVPLGVKPVPAKTRERQPGTPLRVLYVGFLFPPKGAHLLVEALKGLPADAAEVSLYGASSAYWLPYKDQLQAAAQGLPVHFYGPYAHGQLAPILSQHDVLVMPGICEETFSIVTREALMAGLPVIAARRGALPEVVHDGVNGLLFEPEDSADLRRCLTRLITEPKLVERLRNVRPSYKTLEEYGGDMESLYAEISASPYRLQSLQKSLGEQRRMYKALSQAQELLHAEITELSAQAMALQSERDLLREEKRRVEQARDRAVVAVQELREVLDVREREVREREARLAAVYASTTWRLYRCYAACIRPFVRFRDSLGRLRQWLAG